MKLIKIIAVALFMTILFSSSASAITWTGLFSDPNGLHYVPEMSVSGLNNENYNGEGLLVCDGTTVKKFYIYDGSGSSSTIIYNASTNFDDVLLLPDGDCLVTLGTVIYLVDTSSDSLIDFGAELGTSKITTIYTGGSTIGKLAWTPEGYIYFSYTNSNVLYRTIAPKWVVEQVGSMGTWYYTGHIAGYSDNNHVFIAGRYGGAGDSNMNCKIVNVNSGSIVATIAGNNGFRALAAFATNDNKVYFDDSGANYIYYIQDASSTRTAYLSLTTDYVDSAVGDDGIIYMCEGSSITTYATIDFAGGAGIAGEEPENLYTKAEVNSDYDTYVNNTDIYVRYEIETEPIAETNVTTWQNEYSFKIEMYSPSDILLGYKLIDGTSFDYAEYLVGGMYIGAGNMTKASSFKFTSTTNWVNGTYVLKLYEVNKITGNRALLDTDTYLVLFESYEGSVTDQPDDSTEPTGDEVTTTTFLHSTTFKAIGLIMLCAGVMFLFGGFAGGIVGSGLGIIAAYGFGFISFAWLIIMILVVVLAIAALFRDVITGK